MKILASLSLVGVLLTGCASTGGISAQDSLLIACKGYSATLTSLAGYRAADRLSDEQIATVDDLRPTLNAACTGDVVATDDLLAIVEAGLIQMIFIEEGVE